MNLDLSPAEYARLREAALRAGLTPEQYAEQAISAAIRARYVLPKSDGRVLAMRPKREQP
jgi:hypothetical protein